MTQIPADKEKQIDEWMAWRERENAKRRIMTVGEYIAWCRGGDGVSHPSCNNALRGGLTIIPGPPIIGKTVESGTDR